MISMVDSDEDREGVSAMSCDWATELSLCLSIVSHGENEILVLVSVLLLRRRSMAITVLVGCKLKL